MIKIPFSNFYTFVVISPHKNHKLKILYLSETINLGKRPLVRRRGRGGNQFRSTSTGKVGSKAHYPRFPLSEQHQGEIIDLVHERGREAPLSKIRFEDGSVSFVPAVLGTKVGETLEFGLKSKIEKGNVISVQNIPDGTIVCNIEKHFGDGGAIVKSAGTDATVFSHGDEGVTVKLPSGKFAILNPKNRPKKSSHDWYSCWWRG
jgi:large subunit ribosomal protein L2